MMYRRLSSACVLALLGLLFASCTRVVAGEPRAAPATSSSHAEAGLSGSARPTTAPSRPAARSSPTESDSGPAIRPKQAFDTCGAIGWDALPAAARRPDRRPPKLTGPPPGAVWTIGCVWDDRGVGADGQTSGPISALVIFWGTAPPLSTLPADHFKQHGVARAFGGRAGVEIAGVNQGARTCTSFMPVQPKPGVAGVSAAYTDQAVDPCAVVASALDAIAAVVP